MSTPLHVPTAVPGAAGPSPLNVAQHVTMPTAKPAPAPKGITAASPAVPRQPQATQTAGTNPNPPKLRKTSGQAPSPSGDRQAASPLTPQGQWF